MCSITGPDEEDECNSFSLSDILKDVPAFSYQYSSPKNNEYTLLRFILSSPFLTFFTNGNILNLQPYFQSIYLLNNDSLQFTHFHYCILKFACSF